MLLDRCTGASGVLGGLRAPALHQRVRRGLPFGGSPNAVQLRRVASCRAAAYPRKGDEATLWARKEAKLTSRIEELLAANAALTAALAAKEKETAPNARKTGQRVSSGGTPYRAGPTRVVPFRVARGHFIGEEAIPSARKQQLAARRTTIEAPWWDHLRGAVLMNRPIFYIPVYVAAIVFFIDLYSTFGPMASVVIIPGVYMGVRHLRYTLV
ncbi:hypothetical protein D9Q98_000030 [Chlorella vulgaris]|uniref:Uncharacterized protein n=1 Tax=Chlorella vulgaris TaxID=3077 RepID=A0A9D4TXG1_CHLVU|nr:hypothetical protein D9Q98_000030 [Chlorella vulgaris]